MTIVPILITKVHIYMFLHIITQYMQSYEF